MLNSNVPLDFTIGEDGQPRWKQRGADTWYPFKSSSGTTYEAITLPYTATEDCVVLVTHIGMTYAESDSSSRYLTIAINKNGTAVKSASKTFKASTAVGSARGFMLKLFEEMLLVAGDTVSVTTTQNGLWTYDIYTSAFLIK